MRVVGACLGLLQRGRFHPRESNRCVKYAKSSFALSRAGPQAISVLGMNVCSARSAAHITVDNAGERRRSDVNAARTVVRTGRGRRLWGASLAPASPGFGLAGLLPRATDPTNG